jgi:hypothetical protein
VANTTGDGGVTCKQILNIRFFTSEDNIISFTVAKKKKLVDMIYFCPSTFKTPKQSSENRKHPNHVLNQQNETKML